ANVLSKFFAFVLKLIGSTIVIARFKDRYSIPRCFLSHGQFQYEYCEQFGDHSVVLQFKNRHPALNNSIQIVAGSEKRHNIKRGQWRQKPKYHKLPIISIQHQFEFRDLHCRGVLTSTDGLYYDRVVASADCIQMLDWQGSTMVLEVAFNHWMEYTKQVVMFSQISYNLKNAIAILETKIKIVKGYAQLSEHTFVVSLEILEKI
uniref:Peptidase S1 domain-containing protein n=1 Tax=Romanomermis culicivorax TaxID=13658 RepID=A0A915HZG3_ROMCU